MCGAAQARLKWLICEIGFFTIYPITDNSVRKTLKTCGRGRETREK